MGDKITKLSQAIRLGATFRPQCRTSLFQRWASDDIRSCALGGAKEAIGYEFSFDDRGWLLPLNLGSVVMELAERFNVPYAIVDECWRRNDGTNGFKPHTREEVADWVESKGY